MNNHADKTQEIKSQSVSAASPRMQNSGGSTFHFVDNRPEAVAQRKLQEMANSSSQAKQAAQLQAMANNYSTQKDRKKSHKPASIIQGYFTYKGKKLDGKMAESVHGWGHINLPIGDLKTNFFKICNDKDNPTSIEDWFFNNNLQLHEGVFKHLSHYVMGLLELRKNELIFEMKNMYQDTYQSIDDIPGAFKLMKDIASVDISKPTAFAFLEGYGFQVKLLIDFANKSKYVESDDMDEFKPKVKGVETEYKDKTGSSRWADMEINDSDDESSSYIEIKAMATNYNPNEQTKEKFKRQAFAYSQCGKKVTYLFKNKPPYWVKFILNEYKLKFQIDE